MIILDTNVVSEPMRPGGSASVLAWLDRQSVETLFLTATSLSELLVGIAILPDGKRKEGPENALTTLLTSLFDARILPFDQKAATIHAKLVARARAAGLTISLADGQIAAIAAAYGFTVATRDAAPFVAAGLSVIDPWKTD